MGCCQLKFKAGSVRLVNNIQLSLNDNLQIGKNPFYSASATSNNKPYNLTIYANNENTYEIPESFNFGNKLLTNYEVIGNGELYYGERSFSNCKNLKTAKFGNALGFSDGSFSFCKNLEAANLISAHFLETMRSAFVANFLL